MTPADPSLLAQLRQLRDEWLQAELRDADRIANGQYSHDAKMSHIGIATALRLVEHKLDAILEAQPPETAQTPLTFHAFSAANRARCESPSGFKHALSSWTASDWMTALVGEVGEAANIIKKLNRYRDGVPGNKESEVALRDKLRKELGDVFVYLDLLCQSQGFTIDGAAVAVFNQKSKEIGYRAELLAAPPCPNCGGDGWVLGGFDGEMGTPCSSCQPQPADTPTGLAPLTKAMPADTAHWRKMAADTVHHFWFTNREAGVLLDEIDALRAALDAQRQASASVRREALHKAKALVTHLRQPQRYAVEPSAEHQKGYMEALMDVDDEIDQVLDAESAEPSVSPRQPAGGTR